MPLNVMPIPDRIVSPGNQQFVGQQSPDHAARHIVNDQRDRLRHD